MRTTIDIPDPIYRDLKSQAALEGRSVRELVLRRITRPAEDAGDPAKITFPAVPSKNPGSLKLGPEGVYEYIPFPDINVWLALAHGVHPHHEAAIAWGRVGGPAKQVLLLPVVTTFPASIADESKRNGR